MVVNSINSALDYTLPMQKNLNSPYKTSLLLCCWVVFTALSAQTVMAASGSDAAGSVSAQRLVSTNFLDMTLHELMNIPVSDSGTITLSSRKRTPAALTTLDANLIQRSGARDLDELLDLYIPNVQLIRHDFQIMHLGTRGIISDRDNKYLLLVNGKVMNHQTQLGAFSERDIPMLDDIHHVDFIRGSGSVVFGPGAIANVINIVTHDGDTQLPNQVSLRLGFMEKFSALSIRKSSQINQHKFFFYFSATDYDGADDNDSPLFYSHSFDTPQGAESVEAGERVPFNISNDGNSSQLKHKLHGQWQYQNISAWLRITSGGSTIQPYRSIYDVSLYPNGSAALDSNTHIDDIQGFDWSYIQYTAQADHSIELNQNWRQVFITSLDRFEVERLPAGVRENIEERQTLSYGEEQWQNQIRWHYNQNEHQVSFGFDYSVERFGVKSENFNSLTSTQRLRPTDSPWTTHSSSFLIEHQWNIQPQLSLFTGARLDDHTYTDVLYSGRIALVGDWSDVHISKVIVNQAARRTVDDQLRKEFLANGSQADNELSHSVELRHEAQPTETLWLASSLFYQSRDVVAFDFQANETSQQGELTTWGVELEGIYQTDQWQIHFSHGYSKLVDFDLESANTLTGITAQPYGFGDDLASWSNHISKVAMNYHPGSAISYNTSLRVYWGFPGGEDLTNYGNQSASDGTFNQFQAIGDAGEDDAYGASVFLNIGLSVKLNEGSTFRLDAYNILGWVDIKLNKRNYLTRNSDYRSEAAAVALKYSHEF